jgi:hypothetical protein
MAVLVSGGRGAGEWTVNTPNGYVTNPEADRVKTRVGPMDARPWLDVIASDPAEQAWRAHYRVSSPPR